MSGPTPRVPRATTWWVAAATVAGLAWLSCSQDADQATGPDVPLATAQQDLRAAIAVQERNSDRLMAIQGVVGHGIGLTDDRRPVVTVYLARPDVAGIPERLDGLPVAVEVTGMFVALTDPTTRQARPVPIGVSTGHPNITAGTIGARVRDAAGNVFALSNNHVYADQNRASIGDGALQPGPFDGGSDPADRIGTLHAFEPIDFSGGDNVMDAAIAISSVADLDNSTPSDDGYGIPGSTPVAAFVGQLVQKYGRTTKLTHGEIAEINVTVDVCYEVVIIFCGKLARFVNQTAISPGTFSGGGDSGSLIVTDDANKNPVGLLFAAGSTRTIANPIDTVLNRFNVVIDAAPAAPVTDIGISAIEAPSSATTGSVVLVDVTVRNVGNQTVTQDVGVTLRDETDGIEIEAQTIAGGLAAGASATVSFSWNTTGASLTTHTLTARHDVLDDNSGNDSKSATVTLSSQPPPPPEGLHIGDLDPFRSDEGSTWTAYVILQVHDGAHGPIEGATVRGRWTGPGLSVDECTTDFAGECLMLSTLIAKRTKAVTFTVDNVAFSTLTYTPEANHDPDGDSDGTSITVSRR